MEGVVDSDNDSSSGTGVLSRIPLEETETLDCSMLQSTSDSDGTVFGSLTDSGDMSGFDGATSTLGADPEDSSTVCRISGTTN